MKYVSPFWIFLGLTLFCFKQSTCLKCTSNVSWISSPGHLTINEGDDVTLTWTYQTRSRIRSIDVDLQLNDNHLQFEPTLVEVKETPGEHQGGVKFLLSGVGRDLTGEYRLTVTDACLVKTSNTDASLDIIAAQFSKDPKSSNGDPHLNATGYAGFIWVGFVTSSLFFGSIMIVVYNLRHIRRIGACTDGESVQSECSENAQDEATNGALTEYTIETPGGAPASQRTEQWSPFFANKIQIIGPKI